MFLINIFATSIIFSLDRLLLFKNIANKTMISIKLQTFINLHNSKSKLHDLAENSRTAMCHPLQKCGSKQFYETNDKQCDINNFLTFY